MFPWHFEEELVFAPCVSRMSERTLRSCDTGNVLVCRADTYNSEQFTLQGELVTGAVKENYRNKSD